MYDYGANQWTYRGSNRRVIKKTTVTEYDKNGQVLKVTVTEETEEYPSYTQPVWTVTNAMNESLTRHE